MFEQDNRYRDFRSFCNDINSETIKRFKRNKNVSKIVGDVPSKFLNGYLSNILKHEKVDWDEIKRLNDIGCDRNFRFSVEGRRLEMSCTTLRYVMFALEILEHMRGKNLKEVDVVEIGGGYGGQACMMYLLSKDIKIKSYTILDLPEVNNLQKHFIKEWNSELDVACTTLENFTGSPNFLISNYALGEFDKDTQNTYIEKLVKNVEHGFICWNFSPGNQEIHPHFDTIERDVVEENPQTNCRPVKSYNVKF